MTVPGPKGCRVWGVKGEEPSASDHRAQSFPGGRRGYKRGMSEEDARRLAQFVKDHDKRFHARAHPDGADSVVLLTRADDGTALEPVSEVARYQAEQIERDDPGPTVRAAWETWGAALREHE